MEVPRHWRTMPSNIGFVGEEVGNLGTDPSYFRFPGGEIRLDGSVDEIYSRFVDRGFKSEVIEKILFDLFGTVATEASVSFEKIANCQTELVGREVREKGRSEIKFGVNRLPRKISGKTLFSTGTNN